MILIRDAKMPECCADCPLIDFGPGCKIIGGIDADVTEEQPEDCPLTEVVTYKEGTTNGEVIKAIFPNAECREDRLGNVFVISDAQLGYIVFRESWWNAPYKGVDK